MGRGRTVHPALVRALLRAEAAGDTDIEAAAKRPGTLLLHAWWAMPVPRRASRSRPARFCSVPRVLPLRQFLLTFVI